MARKNMVAMILAGGQGSRLGLMTKKMAKPAVSFGGKYRIIDFALSNCSNSGIDTVGILTQYRPQELNAHIGIGTPWDLDRVHGGVALLPPYMSEAGGDWYKGTANAVYQNLNFLDHYNPSYVLMLSGDHIYKMDYRKMLEAHIKAQADATIAVIDVPLEEASRFGIMNTDETDRIVEFEEKPAQPKSNLASMGIYIFNWNLLRDSLIRDEANDASAHDFGKNIIPEFLDTDKRVYAWKFDGYWKDVGTISSLWEANMDLLDTANGLDLSDNSWKIYTEDVATTPQFITEDAEVENSLINQGCVIAGEVKNSVIFTDVTIEKGAEVKDSVVMPNVVIEEGAEVRRVIIAEGVRIGKGVKLGSKDGEIELIAQDRL